MTEQNVKPAQIARNAKCASCGRMYEEHTAGGHYCPIGAKHRTLGFVQFSREQFAAAPSAPPEKIPMIPTPEEVERSEGVPMSFDPAFRAS